MAGAIERNRFFSCLIMRAWRSKQPYHMYHYLQALHDVYAVHDIDLLEEVFFLMNLCLVKDNPSLYATPTEAIVNG